MSLFGDLNEVKVLGNMTNDPELRYTSSGTPVVNFSVATNRNYKQGDEWKEEVQFHNIVVFGNLASSFAQRASKGTRVLLEGRLRTSSWEGNDGKKNYKTEIIANDLFLIDRYEKGKSADLPDPKVTEGSPQGPTGGNSSSSSSSSSKKDDVIDPDDLPF
jgi:single-strand DNA-binding protein